MVVWILEDQMVCPKLIFFPGWRLNSPRKLWRKNNNQIFFVFGQQFELPNSQNIYWTNDTFQIWSYFNCPTPLHHPGTIERCLSEKWRCQIVDASCGWLGLKMGWVYVNLPIHIKIKVIHFFDNLIFSHLYVFLFWGGKNHMIPQQYLQL